MSLQTEIDTLPWYRHFWPWFVIVLLVAMVTISFGLLLVAMKEPFSMVNKDYYQEGLTINRNMKERQHAADLGIRATLAFGDDHRIRVALTADKPLAVADLQLRFDHPLLDSEDVASDLTPTPDAGYVSRVLAGDEWQRLHTGTHWYVTLQSQRGTEIEWLVQGEWLPVQANTLSLHAGDR